MLVQQKTLKDKQVPRHLNCKLKQDQLIIPHINALQKRELLNIIIITQVQDLNLPCS